MERIYMKTTKGNEGLNHRLDGHCYGRCEGLKTLSDFTFLVNSHVKRDKNGCLCIVVVDLLKYVNAPCMHSFSSMQGHIVDEIYDMIQGKGFVGQIDRDEIAVFIGSHHSKKEQLAIVQKIWKCVDRLITHDIEDFHTNVSVAISEYRENDYFESMKERVYERLMELRKKPQITMAAVNEMVNLQKSSCYSVKTFIGLQNRMTDSTYLIVRCRLTFKKESEFSLQKRELQMTRLKTFLETAIRFDDFFTRTAPDEYLILLKGFGAMKFHKFKNRILIGIKEIEFLKDLKVKMEIVFEE